MHVPEKPNTTVASFNSKNGSQYTRRQTVNLLPNVIHGQGWDSGLRHRTFWSNNWLNLQLYAFLVWYTLWKTLQHIKQTMKLLLLLLFEQAMFLSVHVLGRYCVLSTHQIRPTTSDKWIIVAQMTTNLVGMGTQHGRMFTRGSVK